MKNTFSKSKTQPVLYRTKHLIPRTKDEEAVTDRQEKIPGFNQQALSSAKVLLVGGGGVGSQVGEALARKGVGTLIILDHDIVEQSNLPRQKFYKADLYKPKAHRLALNLSKEGFSGTTISGYNLSFQDAISRGVDLTGTLAVIAVDSNRARCSASVYYREHSIPAIFTAVSESANNGYVFVQEPDKACFGCLFPESVNDNTTPCPGTPAILDILKVVAGIVVYAVDTLLMVRPRLWDYKDIFLDGSIPGRDFKIKKREDCALCGVRTDVPQGAARP